MSEPRPIAAADPTTASFWEATRAQRLVLQRCEACGRVQHYPRSFCSSCGDARIVQLEAAGTGTLTSFTVVHRAPHPAFTPPYIVALVRLDEGPTLLTNLVSSEPERVRCDARVRLAWEPLPDGRNLPLFTLEEGT